MQIIIKYIKIILGDKMVIYENGKRIVARAITFIDNNILLIERYRREGNELLHYYTIPGGGVEEGETYEEAALYTAAPSISYTNSDISSVKLSSSL